MLRRGLVDVGELYDMGLLSVVYFWEKYQPTVEHTRIRIAGKEFLRDVEYLTGEMLRYMQSRDPSSRVPETLLKYVPDK